MARYVDDATTRRDCCVRAPFFAPKDFTGFNSPPSSQAQDHLCEARLLLVGLHEPSDVRVWMEGCEDGRGLESKRHDLLALGPLWTCVVLGTLCLSCLDGVMR